MEVLKKKIFLSDCSLNGFQYEPFVLVFFLPRPGFLFNSFSINLVSNIGNNLLYRTNFFRCC